MVNSQSLLQCGPHQFRLKQKYAFIKNSTIFTQSLQNFVTIRYSWVPYCDKVSQWLGKNCGFFNKSIFLLESKLAWPTLYKCEFIFISWYGMHKLWFLWHISRESRFHCASENKEAIEGEGEGNFAWNAHLEQYVWQRIFLRRLFTLSNEESY